MQLPNSCNWPGNDPLMIAYHDNEWGVPLHDDRKLFEFMILDAFQAGLSWKTILHRREGFREAFDNFDAAIISAYTEEKIQQLMQDSQIIRNQLKIRSTVTNALAFLKAQKEFKTFDEYIWQFTGGTTIYNNWTDLKQIPAKSAESDAMSKDLIKRGFKFVGSTICYAFMQASGMVNDHLTYCNNHPFNAGVKLPDSLNPD
jgi:DNA-3-methyladenine glycosylase I